MKIFSLFILVMAIAFISGHKPTLQDSMAEKNSTKLKEGVINNSKVDPESTTEASPKILLLLDTDTRHSGKSPSLWWSYKTVDGC